ncbi:MAG TPA: 4-phosphoerythronate dehydrogenase [Bacteroidota bacterium]|nr:4-phosphoerythronate dehydrogenase [Bacteroidota bacterium]
MSKLKIVVNKNTPSVVEVFSHLGDVTALETNNVTKEAVREADILVVRSETIVNRDLLEGSSVRFVGTVTIGTDHVDEHYLASKGIQFVSAPGSNSNSVAEYMVSALLTWSRRTKKSLQGKTVGIVGVGNVGSKVLRVLKALGMNPLLNDPPLARKTGDSKFRPLDELMNADFITVHVPLTKSGEDATYHLFDEARIRKMKSGSVLINASRGAVVDGTALSQALTSQHLSAAMLDVWEGEPKINTHLLSQVMIGTPHIAGYSLDGKLNACRMVYEAACKFADVLPEWKIKTAIHPPESARILVPKNLTTEQEILSFVVREAYDIEYDDAALRKLPELEEAQHGKYFMKLRAGYRIRREFFNRVVVLSKEQSASSNTLRNFGFLIEVI